jgi:hypothetical protein
VAISVSPELTRLLEDGRGAKLDYHGRCARFWINSYATKHLHSSPTCLTAIQKDQIRTCIVYATRVLDWPLDLSPFQKESLRYVPESGSIMVSYCCFYIIASCQTFASNIPDLISSIDKVVLAAQLMLDMAPDAEHNAHSQALLILKRVEALRRLLKNNAVLTHDASGLTQSTMPLELSEQETMDDLYNFDLQNQEMSPTDMIWDFPMLTPRMW